MTNPWNLVFLTLFAVYFTIRGIYIDRAKGTRTKVSRIDVMERVLLFLVFLGNLLLPLVYIFTSWLQFFDYTLPSLLPWIGTVALIVALWLFWRSHRDLGLNWSPSLEIREQHHLVTHGVYHNIRHPMYSAILLFGIGQGLVLENWLGGWSGLVSFILMVVVRLPREESLMTEFFGDAYLAYMKTTGRLIPRVNRRL
ncbi:MAG: isoprenylcysteine carboxylmethyltransferase family protein [Bacteroidetes bacterium]|nr:isoprenylcysteine carboxylmethyltransferase family protein [Bacteroidota bacterium]